MRVAKTIRFRDPAGCEVIAYGHDAERMLLVTIIGPAEDCPSGCFHRHASAFVRGETILPSRHPYPPEPYDVVLGRLHRAAADAGIDAGGWRDFYEEPAHVFCANHREQIVLESSGDDVYWTHTIAPGTKCSSRAGIECELAGEVRYPLRADPDFERLTVSCH